MERDLYEDNSSVSDSGQLIVLDSQSQAQSQSASLHLPALQEQQMEEGSQDSEIVYPIMDPTADQQESLILVTESEMEVEEKPDVESDALVIAESVSEESGEKEGSRDSSDDTKNVTVIAREALSQDAHHDSLSQDLFAARDENKDKPPTSTPSRLIGSLQLSGQAMLVPETLEESQDQAICPSPDAYDSMPHIIPSTPSLSTDAGQGLEGEYNPVEAQTLNSQGGKSKKKKSQPQSGNISQKPSSSGPSASGTEGEGFAGPTMAEDMPEWQQSQSLCLRMTSSSGSQISCPPQGEMSSQQRLASQTAFDSQGLKDADKFKESQRVHRVPVQSQNTSPQISESFSMSVPRPDPVLPAEGVTRLRSQPQKEPGDTTTSSSSKEGSTVMSVRIPAPKTPVSIDLGHSQSQSPSETFFKLERPQVEEEEKKTEVEEPSASQNVFLRTRHSKKTAGPKNVSGASGDSEDTLGGVKKGEHPAIELSPSDSDPIPCSQNRPRQRAALKEEVPETVEEENDSLEPADPFIVDTVMDSEPEEEEGTQSYEVFPALSRNSPQRPAQPARHMEEAQVPQLLPSTAAISPSAPGEPGRKEVGPRQRSSQSQAVSPRSSQLQPLTVRISQPPLPSLRGSQPQLSPRSSQPQLSPRSSQPQLSPRSNQPQALSPRGSQPQSLSPRSSLVGSRSGHKISINIPKHLGSTLQNTPPSQPATSPHPQFGLLETKHSEEHVASQRLKSPGSQLVESPQKQSTQHTENPVVLHAESQTKSSQHGVRQTKQNGHHTRPENAPQNLETSKDVENQESGVMPQGVMLGSPSGQGDQLARDTSRSTPQAGSQTSRTERLEAQTGRASRHEAVAQTDVKMTVEESAQTNLDPFSFHGSQTQVGAEAEWASTSRVDTSVNTAQALKSKSKGSFNRRRKHLVKKKTDVNPKLEIKSSSTDDSTVNKGAIRPTRKGKQVTKFTRLQKTTAKGDKKTSTNFVTPERPTATVSISENRPETPPELPAPAFTQQPTMRRSPASARASTSMTAELQPLPSTSRAEEEESGGGEAEGSQKLRRRKSVEFSDTVHIGSSPLPFSLESSLSDSQSSDTLLEVTTIKRCVLRVVKRTIVIEQIDKHGNVVHRETSQEEDEPMLMEEIQRTSKRRIPLPNSPARSGSTLASGELADTSSLSLSNKANSGPSSLEHAGSSLELGPSVPLPVAVPLAAGGAVGLNIGSVPAGLAGSAWRLNAAPSIEHTNAPAAERSLGGGTSLVESPAISALSPNQSAIERDDSRMVTSSSSSLRGSDALFSTDNKSPPSDVPCGQQPPTNVVALSSLSSGIVPPTADESSQKLQQTGSGTRSRKSTRRAAADSSQEENRLGGDRVTTDSASVAESQVFVPVSESGGFSVGKTSLKKKSSGSSGSSSSSGKTPPTNVSAARPKSSPTKQHSSQESLKKEETPVVVKTKSKLDIGARVMCRWKDGFFYPATFVGLNTGIGNKFKVLFEDGLEKMVRGVDLVMVQNLPLGQSVLVTGDDDISDPGIIVKHILGGAQALGEGEVEYDVAVDDGSTRRIFRCRRSQMLLSEDQAACLLSDEEYRASLGEIDLALVNTADVSLDNVIQGKRRAKGSPAVGVPRISSPSATQSDDPMEGTSTTSYTAAPTSGKRAGRSQDVLDTPVRVRSQSASSGKGSTTKRKMGPVATSTPTPTPKRRKTAEKQQTPKKAVPAGFSPLGGAVSSPEGSKRPTRRARAGLFDNVKGPIPSQAGLFSGHVFLLTHIDKQPDVLAEEKEQLQMSSCDASGGESTDDSHSVNVPFDKDHLVAQIEAGGGIVLSKLLPSSLTGASKKLFLISDTYQRTVKYIQCLAANLPCVSHTWLIDSCKQNKLLNYKDYILPAGISLEKHVIKERATVSCLKGQRVLLTSSVAKFLEAWTSILEFAQCTVLAKFPANASKNRPGVNVVVTDYTCVKSIEDRAGQLGVGVVGTEWVIQCLINNCLLEHRAHPKYNHQYYKLAVNNQNKD